MKRKLELDHSLPRQMERHNASSSQTTREITPDSTFDRAYDVFLNFRGPDSRHTVVDVLYDGLTKSGIRVFLDDEGIRKGEVIEGELLEAITNSTIYIPVFSKDYASSKWCLRELAKMIDCWETSSTSGTKKVILPIFFDVDVNEDVKLRSQVYTTALQKHKDELGEVVVKPWEDALRKVATIKGWNLKDHGLIKLANLINEEVFNKLTTSEAVNSLPDHLVGIDKPMEDIMELLEEGSPGVRYVVIHGMGGIGKTTLADAIFKKISSRFQGRCFLRDVRRLAKDNGMVKLQEKLLSDTLNLNFIELSDINRGIDMISKRLCGKKVLIVLDDVDKPEHLRQLVAKSHWFGSESRIIITTRNTEFLPREDSKEYPLYSMKEMDGRNALKLFCWNAFDKDWPPPKYHDISNKIVAVTGGLPLAIQVIGSSLYNRDIGEWKYRLDKLKEAPHEDVQEKLMISYKALDHERQQIFLDIACLFNNEKMNDPKYFWEACKLHPRSGIEFLTRRSMIKVINHNTLWMHDQLRDLGRTIAQPKLRGEESEITAKASRLWSKECALDALRKREVTRSLVALKLGELDDDCRFVREEFAGAVNLRYLQLQGGNFEGDFKDVFQELRWLSWFNCPMRFGAANLSFKKLVVLKLSGCEITKDWSEWTVFMEAKQLKVLHLEGCRYLKETPDFSIFLRLERLILKDCSNLKKIGRSINKLRNLNYLEISNFSDRFSYGKLSSMGTNPWVELTAPPSMPVEVKSILGPIGDLKSLGELKIENVGLEELHPSIGDLLRLKLLCLRCPQLDKLPHPLGKLVSLVELDLSYSRIKELPDSIGDLKKLKILMMYQSEIEHLPNTIGKLESLVELNLYRTRITHLPESIGNLKKLKALNVSWSEMKMLPKALIELKNLERLEVAFCRQLDGNLPEEIGKLSRLSVLYLLGTNVNSVPSTINQLSHLQELNLEGIRDFQELSKLPTGLRSLTVMSSSLESHQVPDLSSMSNLVRLVLRGGTGNDSHWTSWPHIQDPSMQFLEDTVQSSSLEPHQVRDLASMTHLVRLVLGVGTSNDSHWTLPRPIQTPNMKWLASLPKIEDLTLDLPDLVSPPTELSSLYRLKSLEIICFDTQSLPRLPSDLESLCLNYVLSPIEWQLFSSLNNLFTLTLNKCWLKEIKVDCQERLRYLSLYNCEFLEKLSNISSLKELQRLEIGSCPHLVDIEGLEEMKSLRSLTLHNCASIRSLPNLSGLKELEELRFDRCHSLENIPEVDEEVPCHLRLFYCGRLRNFDGPYSKNRSDGSEGTCRTSDILACLSDSSESTPEVD